MPGLVAGLLLGLVAGVVVGLLARSGQVARTRTAEARLSDALAAGRRLTDENTGLQQQMTTARSEAARLSAQLEHQRVINQERAAGFEETRQQLTGEFARLSGEALRRNNEQFLQLADSKLNETRQAAEGELGKRQEAIEQLLKPIGEQLGRYDDGMRRLEVERRARLYDVDRTDAAAVDVARPPPTRDPQPGDRAPCPADPRAVGRVAAPARRRDGRHVGAL